MENLDRSWASLGVDENDLMCVDPMAAAQALKQPLNRLSDGEVGAAAMRFGLNIRSDAMILRNRLERHEMRRHFGTNAAPWLETSERKSRIPFRVLRRRVGILLLIFAKSKSRAALYRPIHGDSLLSNFAIIQFRPICYPMRFAYNTVSRMYKRGCERS